MEAESLCELNSLQEAIVPLNKVRHRAGVGDITVTTQEDLRNTIRKERRIELAFEGNRWFDIIRYDNGAYAKQFMHGIGKTNFTAKHLLLPIPQKEIDANPNLTQNAGY
jgi:starch-binding outer membrane protein, SusD/RagB family